MASAKLDSKAHIENLKAMQQTLCDDVRKCHAELLATKGTSAQAFWRRTYARTIFAAIEGLCDSFKKFAFIMEKVKAHHGYINPGMLSVLSGETYSLDDKGEVQGRPFRPSFLSDILFSLRSFQEAIGARHRTTKGNQWDKIKKALSIRHRVTHPKDDKKLQITLEEEQNLWLTYGWFLIEMQKTFDEAGQVAPIPEWEQARKDQKRA